MNKYHSVVVFVICDDEVLMLNRNKKFWMGMWNCVGGKIEKNENHLDAAVRETFEETGLNINKEQFLYLADLEWFFGDEENYSEEDGAYCYIVHIDNEVRNKYFCNPISTDEGILAFKKIDWVLHHDNTGVVPDIFVLLSNMLKGTFTTVTAYYDKENHLYDIISREGVKNG